MRVFAVALLAAFASAVTLRQEELGAGLDQLDADLKQKVQDHLGDVDLSDVDMSDVEDHLREHLSDGEIEALKKKVGGRRGRKGRGNKLAQQGSDSEGELEKKVREAAEEMGIDIDEVDSSDAERIEGKLREHLSDGEIEGAKDKLRKMRKGGDQ